MYDGHEGVALIRITLQIHRVASKDDLKPDNTYLRTCLLAYLHICIFSAMTEKAAYPFLISISKE